MFAPIMHAGQPFQMFELSQEQSEAFGVALFGDCRQAFDESVATAKEPKQPRGRAVQLGHYVFTCWMRNDSNGEWTHIHDTFHDHGQDPMKSTTTPEYDACVTCSPKEQAHGG